MSDKTLLFVYGTLKTGGRLNGHMKKVGAIRVSSRYILEDSRLANTGHGFPALVPYHGPNSKVVGELWAVPEEGFKHLDSVEGVPTLFTREPLELGWGEDNLYGWVYESNNWEHIQSPELINEEGLYEWPV